MKKSFKSIAIGLAALSACALVACGGDGQQTYDATVTADEWSLALSSSFFNELSEVGVKADTSINTVYDGADYDDHSEISIAEFLITETAIGQEIEVSASSMSYNEIENEKWFYENGTCIHYEREGYRLVDKGTVGYDGEIEYDYDDWVKETESASLEEWQSLRADCLSEVVIGYTEMFSDYYSLFTYNSATRSYTYDATTASETIDIYGRELKSAELTFKDKKIVRIEYKVYEEMEITDYGEAYTRKETITGSLTLSYSVKTITPPATFINYEDLD